ncbi:MAG: hypothetical protein ACD_76C00104G0002 [uncultured bacterium]|nr:MAG: hypothetical protein ACD_76C00104G0002 [uncultured bacterium]
MSLTIFCKCSVKSAISTPESEYSFKSRIAKAESFADIALSRANCIFASFAGKTSEASSIVIFLLPSANTCESMLCASRRAPSLLLAISLRTSSSTSIFSNLQISLRHFAIDSAGTRLKSNL